MKCCLDFLQIHATLKCDFVISADTFAMNRDVLAAKVQVNGLAFGFAEGVGLDGKSRLRFRPHYRI
jgi:hypothetical protein